MKYKNIKSASHNFVHSFLSLMNFVDNAYVVDELKKIVKKGYRIEIDFLNERFSPKQMENEVISKSIKIYSKVVKEHFLSHQIPIECVRMLILDWDEKSGPVCLTVDDRGTEYSQPVKPS